MHVTSNNPLKNNRIKVPFSVAKFLRATHLFTFQASATRCKEETKVSYWKVNICKTKKLLCFLYFNPFPLNSGKARPQVKKQIKQVSSHGIQKSDHQKTVTEQPFQYKSCYICNKYVNFDNEMSILMWYSGLKTIGNAAVLTLPCCS